MIKAIRNIPIPVICRLNGVAAGAGCSLALASDMIVASENATLIEVFINVGLVLDSGSSYFLPRLVGSARAFELSTMGSKVTAQQAYDWGMVNRVCKAEDLDEEVKKLTDY
jgi:2-(1,2-epoxy-1,2-dihydrophenyl)acetyl-CoA isomerase